VISCQGTNYLKFLHYFISIICQSLVNGLGLLAPCIIVFCFQNRCWSLKFVEKDWWNRSIGLFFSWRSQTNNCEGGFFCCGGNPNACLVSELPRYLLWKNFICNELSLNCLWKKNLKVWYILWEMIAKLSILNSVCFATIGWID